MNIRKLIASLWIDVVSLIVISIVFVVPFIFIFLTAAKPRTEAAMFEFTWPSQFQLLENIKEVVEFGDGRIFLAFANSIFITVASAVSSIMLAGLIIPPAVVPTIFVLQEIGLYRTLWGMIMVQVAYTMPFAILVFRTFMASIPGEIDEAAIIDGASPMQMFFYVILPLLRPAIITVIVVSSVGIYNDFTGPLYFLPGSQNVTVQVTLFSYISQFTSQWNLLFANVVLITIPPLIMFMFFQRQIVAGMTAGAIKG